MNRVLVVDNNEDWLTQLGNALTEAGCDVLTTWSGAEALGLMHSGGFDTVLVDDYLPDLYVGEFLARLTELPSHPRVVLMKICPTCAEWVIGPHKIRMVDKNRTGCVVSAVISAQTEDQSGTGLLLN